MIQYYGDIQALVEKLYLYAEYSYYKSTATDSDPHYVYFKDVIDHGTHQLSAIKFRQLTGLRDLVYANNQWTAADMTIQMLSFEHHTQAAMMQEEIDQYYDGVPDTSQGKPSIKVSRMLARDFGGLPENLQKRIWCYYLGKIARGCITSRSKTPL